MASAQHNENKLCSETKDVYQGQVIPKLSVNLSSSSPSSSSAGCQKSRDDSEQIDSWLDFSTSSMFSSLSQDDNNSITTDGTASCNELSLADDDVDEITERVRGRLTITSNPGSIDEDCPVRTNEDLVRSRTSVSSSTASTLQQCLGASEEMHFEIARARIVGDKKSKQYVSYIITILRSGKLDTLPCTIERRYSDFEKLFKIIKRKFPKHAEKLSFPKKEFKGNFKDETIAKRSRAFEELLTQLFKCEEIRVLKEFNNFFYEKDLRVAYSNIRNISHAESLPLLLNCASVQSKLLGERHKESIATMCSIVAVYKYLDCHEDAQIWADTALHCIGQRENNRYLIPLLKDSIRLCFLLGKDKSDLETRLQNLRDRHFPVDLVPSLLELAVNRFSD